MTLRRKEPGRGTDILLKKCTCSASGGVNRTQYMVYGVFITLIYNAPNTQCYSLYGTCITTNGVYFLQIISARHILCAVD